MGASMGQAVDPQTESPLLLTAGTNLRRRLGSLLVRVLLFTVTSVSAVTVFFIFVFIIKDAVPFFALCGVKEFFTSTRWYPSAAEAEFGALAIFAGSALVTVGAVLFAVPLGVAAAVCLSEVLSFKLRQVVKPVIEMLASVPSVAYGFFALVVLAPMMQDHGGRLLSATVWVVGVPVVPLGAMLGGVLVAAYLPGEHGDRWRIPVTVLLGAGLFFVVFIAARWASGLQVDSGTNALNVSLVLGVMILPTVVSVSEDALQAVGRDMREASYALGATRAETVFRVLLPAASSGICAAIILGLMRALGETMVVWMASGNAARIPEPWINYLKPVRTLTATIAGDMGEADHVTGSARYHVLFAMALCLVTGSFLCNLASEWFVKRERRKMMGA